MSDHMEDERLSETKTDIKPSKNGSVLFPNENKYSHIKNKIVRNQQYLKAKKEKKKVRGYLFSMFVQYCEFQAKKLAKKERNLQGGSKQTPHTLESLRIKDETTVDDLEAEDNELVRNDFDNDEFSEYYKQTYEPKVLITYADNPMRVTILKNSQK